MSDALEVHEIFKRGDFEALRAVVDSDGFPNCDAPHLSAHCLEYAIYHAPLSMIRALLEAGGDPNDRGCDGFPPLIAAISTDREDRHEVLELLVAAGADVDQRGVNDYTPLHYAAARDDLRAIELLVGWGADLDARTHIDDRATPLQEARILGKHQAAALLERLKQREP